MKDNLQALINQHRAAGVEILVQHVESGCSDSGIETIISIAFSDDYDAMAIGAELEDIIGGCDAGAGFGYRDLQTGQHIVGLR